MLVAERPTNLCAYVTRWFLRKLKVVLALSSLDRSALDRRNSSKHYPSSYSTLDAVKCTVYEFLNDSRLKKWERFNDEIKLFYVESSETLLSKWYSAII